MNYDNELLELKVTQVVSSILSCRIIDVNVDTKLSYLGMDSLDRVELQMRCEDYFCITIADDDMQQVKTVGDLITLIKNIMHIE